MATPDEWYAADQDDADAGVAMIQQQTGGSVSVPQAPAAGDVVGDWTRVIEGFGRGVSGIAGLAGQISATRANAQIAADRTSFERFERDQQAELRRAELTAKTELTKLGFATELARARLGAASPGASILYNLASAPAQTWIMYAIVAGAGYLVWQGFKK